MFRTPLVVLMATLVVPAVAGQNALPPDGRSPVTVRQTVEMRMFLNPGVALSPDGRYVAYVLAEPSFAKNYNEHVIYVVAIPSGAGSGPG